MVMPERLPMALPATHEGPALTTPAARGVAPPKVASAEFTTVPKLHGEIQVADPVGDRPRC